MSNQNVAPSGQNSGVRRIQISISTGWTVRRGVLPPRARQAAAKALGAPFGRSHARLMLVRSVTSPRGIAGPIGCAGAKRAQLIASTAVDGTVIVEQIIHRPRS